MRRGEVRLPKGARVLVRLPNWIGDVILCTPSLAALKRARPDLALDALVKAKTLPAVEGLPLVDRVRVLERERGVFTDASALRDRAYDAVLVFPKGFREALLARLARIPVRVGLATDRRSLLLTHPVPFTKEDWLRHHAEQFAMVLAPLGVALEGERTSFPVTEEGRREAKDLLEGAGVEGPYAVFNAEASKAPRAWHASRFGKVASFLRETYGLRSVLAGTGGDGSVREAFLAECPSGADLTGRTTLRGLAALLASARLFVGNDSGPMHVAAAVGAPVAVVFGPGSPAKTAPYNHKLLSVVWADLPCSPCRQSFWRDCAPDGEGKPPCLQAVSSEAMARACARLLEETEG